MSFFVLLLIFFCFIPMYTYIIYPLLIILLSLIYKKHKNFVPKSECKLKTVSIIVPLFNEFHLIKNKIKNFKTINYPNNSIELLFAVDGYGKTRLKELETNIKILYIKKRVGKSLTQYIASKYVAGDIIILTDINSYFNKKSIENIVGNINNGCDMVGGILKYSKEKENHTESLYWNCEIFLKNKESLLGYPIGFHGSIIGIKKQLYNNFPYHLLCDLSLPVYAHFDNKKAIYSDDIIVYEKPDIFNVKNLYIKKTRIVQRGLHGLKKILFFHKFNLLKKPILLIMILSHKILRWLTPFFLIIIFLLTYYTSSSYTIINYFLKIQIILYMFSIFVSILKISNILNQKYFNFASYIFITLTAAGSGVITFLFSNSLEYWNPSKK